MRFLVKKCVATSFGILILFCLSACSEQPEPVSVPSEYQKELQLALIQAKPGDVITIPAGVHPINRGLSLNVSGVTLRGEGMDKSVLSFKNQLQGAEGLLVNASDFTIESAVLFGGVASLIVLRFLVGMVHAPIFPVTGGTTADWFPIGQWACRLGLGARG